jgi:hypothetical protein
MKRGQITAAVVAAVLGVAAAGCGRENEEGNPGQDIPEGTPSTVEPGGAGTTPTGEEQPSITQPEGG